jgi:hypothetical protein
VTLRIRGTWKRNLRYVGLLLLGLVQCENRTINLGKSSSGGASQEGGTATAGGASGSSAGGSGGTGNLNNEEPLFKEVKLIEELAANSTDFKDENPTLTDDALEVYFYSTRRQGDNSDDDIWFAKRTSASDPFDEPVLLTPVSTDASEISPAISGDGLTLWIGTERDGGLGGRDIWRYERTSTDSEFGETATLEPNVNSDKDDIPRPLGFNGRCMPLASRLDGNADYQTYFSTRTSTTSNFSTPVRVPNLTDGETRITDGFLTNDGLSFYFVMGVSEVKGDIYVAFRESPTLPFGTPIALSTINTADFDERDPFLTADGKTLYFVSTREDDVTRIYQATRVTE